MPHKTWELYISISGRRYMGTFEGSEKEALKEADRRAQIPKMNQYELQDESFHDVEVEEA